MMAVAAPKHLALSEHILTVASKHFAEKGFSGARIDEIAADAGVNKASIYYHLGGKETLYAEIFARALSEAVTVVQQEVDQYVTVDDKVRAYVNGFKNLFTRSSPYLARMMMREMASGGERVPREALHSMGQVQTILHGIIEEGCQQGLYRAINPFIAHMMIVGSLEFLVTGEDLRKRVAACAIPAMTSFGQVSLDEAAREISEFILLSLKKAH